MFKAMAGKLGGEETVGKLAAFMPQEKDEPPAKDAPARRFDKALLAIKGVAQQVCKVDKDGLDVLMVGDDVQSVSGGVKNVNDLMGIFEGIEPDGGLALAPAIRQALEQATARLTADDGDKK